MEDRPEFLEAVSSDGRRVLEAELGDEAVDIWIVQARKAGAELLWLHTGCRPRRTRLRALPRLRPDADGASPAW